MQASGALLLPITRSVTQEATTWSRMTPLSFPRADSLLQHSLTQPHPSTNQAWGCDPTPFTVHQSGVGCDPTPHTVHQSDVEFWPHPIHSPPIRCGLLTSPHSQSTNQVWGCDPTPHTVHQSDVGFWPRPIHSPPIGFGVLTPPTSHSPPVGFGVLTPPTSHCPPIRCGGSDPQSLTSLTPLISCGVPTPSCLSVHQSRARSWLAACLPFHRIRHVFSFLFLSTFISHSTQVRCVFLLLLFSDHTCLSFHPNRLRGSEWGWGGGKSWPRPAFIPPMMCCWGGERGSPDHVHLSFHQWWGVAGWGEVGCGGIERKGVGGVVGGGVGLWPRPSLTAALRKPEIRQTAPLSLGAEGVLL